MYSTEWTQRSSSSNSSNSDADSAPPAVQLRCLGERPTLNEEKMSSFSHSEDQETEDLKAFERRLEELATATRPRPFRWRLVIGTIFACTAISACHWLQDVRESKSILLRSLSSRGALGLSLATVVVLIFYGVKHAGKRQPSAYVGQTRDTLALFQLRCDNDGHLLHVAPIPRDHHRRTSSRSSRTSR